MVQIRNVPAEFHRRLKARAALEGLSMSDYILREVGKSLDVPTRDSKLCQGTLLSRAQYLVDIDEWGYEDARLLPRGGMTPEQVAELKAKFPPNC